MLYSVWYSRNSSFQSGDRHLHVEIHPFKRMDISPHIIGNTMLILLGCSRAISAHTEIGLVRCDLGYGSLIGKGLGHHFQPMPIYVGVATD